MEKVEPFSLCPDSLSTLIFSLQEDGESDKQCTPLVDTRSYIKPCKQHPALSSTSASATLPFASKPISGIHFGSATKFQKSEPLKHIPRSHGYLYLFIYLFPPVGLDYVLFISFSPGG